MRTLRAALASTTPLVSPRPYELSRNRCSATRNGCTSSAEIAVRFQPFWLYGFGRFACTPPVETPVRFRPFYTPAALGGLEVDPITFTRAVEVVAQVDGSAGWLVAVAATYSALPAYLSEEVARQLTDDPTATIAGTINPNGRAVVVPAGIESVADGRSAVGFFIAAGSLATAW